MKKVIYFLLLLLTSCQPSEIERQKLDFILAGVSDGLLELKYDPPKIISILNTEPKPDSFKIDLDNDEIDDIMLISDGYISPGAMLAVSYAAPLNSNISIALSADSLCIKKIDYLDSINQNLNWSNEVNIKYRFLFYKNLNPDIYILGEWENDLTGYLGIYLKEQEKFAYCKLSIQLYKDITLYSYAVQQ